MGNTGDGHTKPSGIRESAIKKLPGAGLVRAEVVEEEDSGVIAVLDLGRCC